MKNLSNCCASPKAEFSSDKGTYYDMCSKCEAPFIPQWICKKCAIILGKDKVKGCIELVEKEGVCGFNYCEKKGKVVPPQFYNIR